MELPGVFVSSRLIQWVFEEYPEAVWFQVSVGQTSTEHWGLFSFLSGIALCSRPHDCPC